MLLSLNRQWDLRKHGARPRNPRQEEPLPSTALQLTPLFRQCKFTTTTLPTEKWSCKHALHQRKKIIIAFWSMSSCNRETAWEKWVETNQRGLSDLLVLGRWWLIYTHRALWVHWFRVLLLTGSLSGYWTPTANYALKYWYANPAQPHLTRIIITNLQNSERTGH